jgi:hypothetical protein
LSKVDVSVTWMLGIRHVQFTETKMNNCEVVMMGPWCHPLPGDCQSTGDVNCKSLRRTPWASWISWCWVNRLSSKDDLCSNSNFVPTVSFPVRSYSVFCKDDKYMFTIADVCMVLHSSTSEKGDFLDEHVQVALIQWLKFRLEDWDRGLVRDGNETVYDNAWRLLIIATLDEIDA